MLTHDEHRAQAAANERFLSLIDCGAHADWCVTVLFYAALHHVDAHLTRTRQQPEKHGERFRMIRADPKAKKIWVQYDRLWKRSVAARYDCVRPTPADLERLRREDYEAIKREMA